MGIERLRGPRIVDLTAPLSPDLWRYADAFPSFSSEQLTDYKPDGFVMHRISMGTHLGTHTDAASHLLPNGWRLGDLDLGAYAGPATVARIHGAEPLGPIDAVRLQDALPALKRGNGVLISTGWDSRFGKKEYATEHPYLTEAAAKWLVDCGARFVAADLPGLMDPRIDLSSVNAAETSDGLLLQARIPYIVGLVNVSTIASVAEVTFIGMPLRIDGADGSPVRAAIFVD